MSNSDTKQRRNWDENNKYLKPKASYWFEELDEEPGSCTLASAIERDCKSSWDGACEGASVAIEAVWRNGLESQASKL